MSKMFYAIVYLIIASILISFLVQIGRNADRKGKSLRKQILMIFVANIIYMCSFFVNDITQLSVVHCIMACFEVWISYYFLTFGCEYIGLQYKFPTALRVPVMVVICADCAMLISNLATGYFFSFTPVLTGTEVYLQVNVNAYYLIHIVLCLALQLANILILVVKAYKIPKVFRGRYFLISNTFVIGMVASTLIRSIGGYVMFPVMLFFTYGEVVYFAFYYYIPKMRNANMNSFVIKNMASPVFLFDDEDKVQVYNDSAAILLGIKEGIKLQDFIADNNLRLILTEERRREGKTKEFTLTTKIDDLTYLIHGQELYDRRGGFIGTLLLYNDITSQEKLKEEAAYHATRDILTGVWNRDYFFEVVEKTLRENPETEFIMIASDVHQFMMFNDILGKFTGDDLLIAIAKGFEERCKELWEIGRIAGDRFAMIMPKADYNEERFLSFTKKVFEKRGYSLQVRIYLGVYDMSDRSLKATAMYDRAYMALESIKGDMESGIAYYSDDIRAKRLHETMTIEDMDHALKNQEFVIFLQPQMDTVNMKVAGCEALVRWLSPKKGMIAPVEFIPLFETNGMISKLDYYVWEEACKVLRRWKNEGHMERSISVNISAKDFYLTDLYHNIVGLVEKYEINPRNLKLEITETAFVLDVKQQMELVKKFRDYGFIIEIDDFGSGYSSLNSLKDISVDILKLDMKFFEKTDDEARAQKIIESVITLAYNLNMPVVAEGVEAENQVEMLKRMGCEIVQGFFYAKPMPVEEFEKFIEIYPCEDFATVSRRLLSPKRES